MKLSLSCVAGSLALSLLLTVPERTGWAADDGPGARRNLELNLTVGLAYVWASKEAWNCSGDVCTQGSPVALSLSASLRPHPIIDVGARFWYEHNRFGQTSHTLDRFVAEARLFPFGYSRFEPWLGVGLGLAAAYDSMEAHAGLPELSLSRTALDWGVGTGARVRLGRQACLGASFRVYRMEFEDQPWRLVPRHEPGGEPLMSVTNYADRTWFSVLLAYEHAFGF